MCEKTFTQAGHLDRHVRNVHKQEKQHKCKECDNKFSMRNHLKLHILTMHSDLKHHQIDCSKIIKFNQFDRSFAYPGSLHIAIKTEEGELGNTLEEGEL